MTRASKWFSKNLIKIYAFLGFTYLFIPVIYTFVFSFNNSVKSNLVWRGFTLNNWKNPCAAPDVCNALGNSLKIGLIATIFCDDPWHSYCLCAWKIFVPHSLCH